MMHPVLKEALFANWDTITSNLPFDLILTKFNWAFSTDEYESIILESSETRRREQLLLVLSQKGDVLFYELIKYFQFNESQLALSASGLSASGDVDSSRQAVVVDQLQQQNRGQQSEIVRTLVGYIECAYEIQTLKNVRWHGLSAPNVRYVRHIPESQDLSLFTPSIISVIQLTPSVKDKSIDNLSQWSESICWALMKQNEPPGLCVVFHEILTANDDYCAIIHDLFLFLTRKCKDFVSSVDLHHVSSSSPVAILSRIKSLTSKLKIITLLGSLKCNDRLVKLLHSLNYAGVTVVLYSLDVDLEMTEDLENAGLKIRSVKIEEITTSVTEDSQSDALNKNEVFGAVNYVEPKCGSNCGRIFDDLPAKVQVFLKQCAILKNRIVYVKVIKCLWKFVFDSNVQDVASVNKMHDTINMLIEQGVFRHFLGSYFFSPSMKAFLLKKIQQNGSEVKVLNQNLLQAYLERYKTWSSVPAGDIYFQQYYLRHLLKAGGTAEALNLFANLEWILQKCSSIHSKCFVSDLNRLIKATKLEEREPLEQLLKIVQKSISNQSSVSDHQQMLLAYIVSSFSNKINKRGSIFSRFFESLPAVLNNDNFWVLPLNSSIVDSVLLTTSEIEYLPLNSKVLLCDSSSLIISTGVSSLIVVNRQSLELESRLEFMTDSLNIAFISHFKDKEFNVVTKDCVQYRVNFATSQISEVALIHENGRIVKFHQIFDKFVIVSVHEDFVLNVWCSITFQLFASVSLKSGQILDSTLCPSIVKLSYAITESDTVVLSTILNWDSEPQCIVYEYDCDSMELEKRAATIAMNCPMDFAALSTSCDLIVCFTGGDIVDLYSIGSETYMKTTWAASISKPQFFHRTKRGIYLFADEHGQLEVCSLEGEAQITTMWSHTLPLTSKISQLFVGADDDTLCFMSNTEQFNSCSFFQLSKVMSTCMSDNPNSPVVAINRVSSGGKKSSNQQSYLSGDGSLIYTIGQKRIICEATDTLNPVQIYSLSEQVVKSCFVDEGFSALFVFFENKTFVVLKCPSFETVLESTCSSNPIYSFFREHLLVLIFEDIIEIWDCNIQKKVLINIGIGLSVNDAYIEDDKLYILLSNATVKVINLQDMTWDVLDPVSLQPNTFIVKSSSLNDCYAAQLINNQLTIIPVFAQNRLCSTVPVIDSKRYVFLHFQALPSNKFAMLLNDTSKFQLVVRILFLNEKEAVMLEVSSDYISYESFLEEREFISNAMSFNCSFDAKSLMCLSNRNEICIYSQNETRKKWTNLSKLLGSKFCFSQALFVSNSTMFASGNDASFYLIDVNSTKVSSRVTLPDAGPLCMTEVYSSNNGFTLVITSDVNGLFMFWRLNENCETLNLVHKREHSSVFKSDSIPYFGILNTTIYFICLTTDDNALVWTIESDTFEVSLCDQCQSPVSSLTVSLDIENYSMSFLRDDFSLRSLDIESDSWSENQENSERFMIFRKRHRFLGTSGLVVSVGECSGTVDIWDSISHRLCMSLGTKFDLISGTSNDSGLGQEAHQGLVDLKVLNEKCLIFIGYKHLLEVWEYNEEALLLDTSDDGGASEHHASRPKVRLSLPFELTAVVVCSDTHSVFALIDSKGGHHLMELYNKQLTNENADTKAKSFYCSKLEVN